MDKVVNKKRARLPTPRWRRRPEQWHRTSLRVRRRLAVTQPRSIRRVSMRRRIECGGRLGATGEQEVGSEGQQGRTRCPGREERRVGGEEVEEQPDETSGGQCCCSRGRGIRSAWESSTPSVARGLDIPGPDASRWGSPTQQTPLSPAGIERGLGNSRRREEREHMERDVVLGGRADESVEEVPPDMKHGRRCGLCHRH